MENYHEILNEAWWAQGAMAATSVGLGFWAKSLSQSVNGMGLSTLIQKTIQGIFSNDAGFSVWVNIFLPGVLYLVSAILVSALIYHYIRSRNMDGKVEFWLKICLSVILAVICGYMAYLGAILFSYAIIIGLVVFLAVGIIIAALGSMFNGGSSRSRSR